MIVYPILTKCLIKIILIEHDLIFIADNTKQDSEGTNKMLPRKEVIRRLRERGEPILLYGESELEAFTRLRRCEILEPEINKVWNKSLSTLSK